MSGLKGNQKRGESGRFTANPAARPTQSLKSVPTGNIARIDNKWYELTPIKEGPVVTSRPKPSPARENGLAGAQGWQLDDEGAIGQLPGPEGPGLSVVGPI